MTKDRAIRVLDVYASVNGSGQCAQDEFEEAKKMAIEALEKQTSKKAKRIITNKEVAGNFRCVCPSCGWLMFERVTTKDKSVPVVYRICDFCQSCGQRIDWGES